jgi:hypothetical protein
LDETKKIEKPSSTETTTTKTTTIKAARNSSSVGSKKVAKLDEKKTAPRSATPKKKPAVELRKPNITISGKTHENLSDSIMMNESSGTESDDQQPELADKRHKIVID